MKKTLLKVLSQLIAIKLVLVIGFLSQGHALELALTPPMGWNSWNKFGCDVNEEIILQAIDAMASSGMREVGYQYVVIDDCWQAASRSPTGQLMPDPLRFPNGIKFLADYAHHQGLKLGIYSDAGNLTCQRRPGSLGYEDQDAQTFADWGIDYLKYDWCNTRPRKPQPLYTKMSLALAKTQRPILFAICNWGLKSPWIWGPKIAQTWRTAFDIKDNWPMIMTIVNLNSAHAKFAGPGHWNDPDTLEVGNDNLNSMQAQSHFALWAMMAAPLIAGNDLSTMTEETHSLLSNAEIIAVDQDPLGAQGTRIKTLGGVEIWLKPLTPQNSQKRWAVLVFNNTLLPKTFYLPLSLFSTYFQPTKKSQNLQGDIFVQPLFPEVGEVEKVKTEDRVLFDLDIFQSKMIKIILTIPS